jgi:Flp pilus assembly protein TadG
MRTILRRILKRESGQSLAEFAMIAPVLVILVFGIIDIARAYNGWVTVQGAARQGARYAVTGRSECAAATPSRLTCIEHVAREHAGALTNSGTTVDVNVRSWEYPSYSGSAIEGSAGEQCDAVEVEVQYEFEPATPMFESLFGGVTMTGRERMVNEPFGACDS